MAHHHHHRHQYIHLPQFDKDEFLSQFLDTDHFSLDRLLQELITKRQPPQGRMESEVDYENADGESAMDRSYDYGYDDEEAGQDREEGRGGREVQSESSKELQKLEVGLSHVKREIGLVVRRHHKQLVRRIDTVQHLERELQTLRTDIMQLKKSTKSLHSTIAAPYLNMRSRLNQMANMCSAAQTMREVHLFIRQINRLNTVTGHAQFDPMLKKWSDVARLISLVDMTKYTPALFEIENIRSGDELQGIDIFHNNERRLKNISKWTRKRAGELLKESMKSMSQSDVSNALQVFYNLKILPEEIKTIVHNVLTDMQSLLRDCFRSNIMQSHFPKSGTDFLSRFNENLSRVSSLYEQLWHLDRIVAKKKDPLTQASFDAVAYKDLPYSSIAKHSWQEMTTLFTKAFKDAFQGDPTTKQLLVNEYPGVSECLNFFMDSLDRQQYVPFLSEEEILEWAPQLVGMAEQGHLDMSLDDMMEKVDSLLAEVRAPETIVSASQQSSSFEEISYTAIRNLTSSIANRLQSCKSNYVLMDHMARRVVKVVSQFVVGVGKLQVHSDRAVSLSMNDLYGDSRFVLPIERRFNANLYNAIFVVGQVLNSMITSLNTARHQQEEQQILRNQQYQSQEMSNQIRFARQKRDWELMDTVCDTLSGAVDSLETQALQIIEPVFEAIIQRCDDVLSDMHSQYERTILSEPAAIGTLPYVEKLERDLKYIRQLYLAVFDARSQSFDKCCITLASSILQCMAKQVAVLRPMTKNVTLRLATEMVQIEYIVSSTVLSQLNRTTKALSQYRAMRGVLFTATKDAIRGGEEEEEEREEKDNSNGNGNTSFSSFINQNSAIDRILLLTHLFSHLDKIPPASVHADLDHTMQELPSPPIAMEMAPADYIRWMDQHSKGEVVSHLSNCVERCLQNLAQFDQQQALQQYFVQKQQEKDGNGSTTVTDDFAEDEKLFEDRIQVANARELLQHMQRELAALQP